MAWVNGGAKGRGGYPHGRRGAYAVACPEEPCRARIGARCSVYTKDADGNPIWVRYSATPHPARVEAGKIHAAARKAPAP